MQILEIFFVQKAPACSIGDLATAVKKIFNAYNPIKHIGIRHGEKMYEVLLSSEEKSIAVDMGEFYRVPMDTRSLNYDKYNITGLEQDSIFEDFNSKKY